MHDNLIINLISAPLHITLDVTSMCNAKCLHCYNRSGLKNSNDDLNDEEFMNIILQIADLKPFSICYCGGEPMLKYMQLLKASRILKDAGVPNISFVSNGWFITKEKVVELKKNGVSYIQISIDGAYEETHDFMRGIKGIFKKAMNAIKVINECEMNFAVAFSPTSFNIREFPDVVETLLKYERLRAIRIQPLMPMGVAQINKLQILPNENDYRWLVKWIKSKKPILLKKGITLEWGDPIDHLRRFTQEGNQFSPYIEIKSDGKLGVSSYLPLRVGDLKKHSINDYWKSGLGKIWGAELVKNMAKKITSIKDLGFENQDLPNLFYEDNIELDIIDKNIFRRT